jgi:hypothetical protein
MAYGNRRYDFGLRGSADTSGFRGDAPQRLPMGGRGPGGGGDRRMEPRTPRVTARYNRDYVYGGRGEDNYPLNFDPYGGNSQGRIGGDDMYRRPYTTIAGTRTFRGSPDLFRSDRDQQGYDRNFRGYDRSFRRR